MDSTANVKRRLVESIKGRNPKSIETRTDEVLVRLIYQAIASASDLQEEALQGSAGKGRASL